MDATPVSNKYENNPQDDNAQDDMTTKAKYINAVAKPDPTPWMYTDGAGNPHDRDNWKIVEPLMKDTPEPPPYTRLSDLQVFNVVTSQDITQVDKHKNWPMDFESRGGIHPERPPQSPTVHVR